MHPLIMHATVAGARHMHAAASSDVANMPPGAACTVTLEARVIVLTLGWAPAAGTPAVEDALRQELSTQREVSSRLRSEVAGLKRELEEVNRCVGGGGAAGASTASVCWCQCLHWCWMLPCTLGERLAYLTAAVAACCCLLLLGVITLLSSNSGPLPSC
jgi:hypothetical protein